MRSRRARKRESDLLKQLELLAGPGDGRDTGGRSAGSLAGSPADDGMSLPGGRPSRARAEVAATATRSAARRRKRPAVKWGDLVAVFLVLALSCIAAYNQGLLDSVLARLGWSASGATGDVGQSGQPGTPEQGAPGEGTPSQTGQTGETGGSGQGGSTLPSGRPGEEGDSGGPGEPGQPDGPLAPLEMALSARALYLTMDTAGTPSRMASIMKYVRAHEGLNSFVIDIKDNNGRVPARPPEHIPAKAAGYSHLPGLIKILADLDYYMIARIVAFQDPYRAEQEPERAIRRADGSLWRDRDGRLWLNPYDKKNWEYVRDIALWAVEMGFHEIQLDYVRFPDSARGLETSGTVIMPGYEEYESRGDCIAAFLEYMSEALEGKAYLGADIFGFATIASDDMGIGHKWEQLADKVDFMCPMVYPSHYYNPGIYGFQVPEAHPYEVVYKAMGEALERSEGLRAKVRPWLQDFSLRIKYGSKEVSDQIRATFERGITTYMLWNPANVYTDGVDYVPEVEVLPEDADTG